MPVGQWKTLRPDAENALEVVYRSSAASTGSSTGALGLEWINDGFAVMICGEVAPGIVVPD